MTHEDYVTLEQAKKLKMLGFNDECLCTLIEYHDCVFIEYPDGSFCMIGGKLSDHEKPFKTYPAPTLTQAAKWIREEHHLAVIVKLNGVRTMWFSEVWTMTSNGPVYHDPGVLFESYDEALSHGISKALELLADKEQ